MSQDDVMIVEFYVNNGQERGVELMCFFDLSLRNHFELILIDGQCRHIIFIVV